MTQISDNRPVFLCGMMGSGKTTIGRLLAEKLNRQHIDLDLEIEEREQATIPQIFRTRGETGFREAERRAIEQVVGQTGSVISLGGGALQNDEIIDLIKRSGILIFLEAPRSVLLKRLRNDTSRPLLQSEKNEENLRNRIEKLLKDRTPNYSQSHVTVSTAQLCPESVAETILEKISEL